MNQPTNPGGRPAIGPAISVAYPATLLADVDAAATQQRTSRAQWLREAAVAALPFRVLQRKADLQDTMEEVDDSLATLRKVALDAEYDREEREFRAEAYASTIREMRLLLGQIRDSLPKQEARDAYAQADVSESENSTARAQVWAKTMAADTVDDILDALTTMLPVDGASVRNRATLDDPNENLD
jgi:hypothetical protein